MHEWSLFLAGTSSIVTVCLKLALGYSTLLEKKDNNSIVEEDGVFSRRCCQETFVRLQGSGGAVFGQVLRRTSLGCSRCTASEVQCHA